MAELWNGTTWTAEALTIPVTVRQSYLQAVSCTSSSACEAVGYYANPEHPNGKAFGESWNGTSWTYEAVTSASFSLLLAVSCEQATACSAVGVNDNDGDQRLAESWNGKRWTKQVVPANASWGGSQLNSVSCATASRCVAVGQYLSDGVAGSFAESLKGATWTETPMSQPSGATIVDLSGISCTAVTACLAIGFSYPPDVGLAESWNGSSWSVSASPPPYGAYAISCTSATSCTVTADGPSAETWDGTSWTGEGAAEPPGSPTYAALVAVSCVSSWCAAVGNYQYETAGASMLLAEAT